MNNQEILTKAIKKAVANGWEDPFGIVQLKRKYGWGDDQWSVAHTAIVIRQYSRNTKRMEDEYYQFELFIFNHDFAKALWGKELEYFLEFSSDSLSEAWKVHLASMVIADDPIAYLAENM